MARVEDKDTDHPPIVLFMCVHNAGRSQMALGWFSVSGGGGVNW
jgi:protein-tyrosine-phosphatase